MTRVATRPLALALAGATLATFGAGRGGAHRAAIRVRVVVTRGLEAWSVPAERRAWRHRWTVEIRQGRPVLVDQQGQPPPQLWS